MSWLDALWPYLTLGVGSMVAEEAAPLLGGIAARDGRLVASAVVVGIGGSTWVLTGALYYLGRLNGRWVRRRFPRLRHFVLRAVKVVRRHPWRASLLVRWVFGLRIALPIACGAARVPQALFLVASAVSCFAWALVFVGLGWIFGSAAQGFLRDFFEWMVAAAVAASATGWWIARRRRLRLERAAVEVIAGHEDMSEEERKGI